MTTLRAPRHQIVAAEVRAALSRQGLRQKDLACFLDISPASTSELWHGKVPYTLDRLDMIAAWLGIGMADLLGADAPTPDPAGVVANSGWRTRRGFLRRHRPANAALKAVA